MSIELKQAAQQALSALEKSQPHPSNPVIGLTNQDFIDHEETIRQLRTAIQQAEAKTDEPVARLDEMLADTKEFFDANGTETPQVVRDVIEYVASWITVYNEKRHPAPDVPDGHVLVPIEPTEKMLRAYTGGALTEAGFRWCRHQWAVMLAAAQEPS